MKITKSAKKVARWLFLLLFLAYLMTASGRIDSGDGLTIFKVSQNLLSNGAVTLPPPDPDLIAFDAQGRPLGKAVELGIEDGYSIRGRNGNYYSSYGLGHSVLLVPFIVLGQIIAWIIGVSSPAWLIQFVTALLFNPLVSAATGVAVYLSGLRLSFSPAKSLTLTIIYAFGTMTWVYAKSFFSDPLIALFLLVAFYSLLSYRFDRRSNWLWMGGMSLGLAIWTKPATVINIPIFVLYLFIITKTKNKLISYKQLFIFVIPIVVGIIGVMLFNWWRFETPLDTGYRNIGWTFPFFKGLYGLVLSPGKGYLLYNPIIIAAFGGMSVFWRQHRSEFWLIVGLLLINLLFLAKYDHWHGGGSWGPRLLLPLTPLLILPLGSLLEHLPPKSPLNLLLALFISLSVIVQIPGLSVNYARFLQRVYALSVEEYYERVTFEVAYSPLIRQWGEMREVFANLRDPDRRTTIKDAAFQNDSELQDVPTIDILSANLPDFWFVYLGFMSNEPTRLSQSIP